LRAATGPSTDEQKWIATAMGCPYGDEPRSVFSAIIEAWLEPILWSRDPLPATERQWAFLRELGHISASPDLVRPVGSAWIEHYLSIRTAESLETLELHAGDSVYRERSLTDPDTGEITRLDDVVTVSSIGANGLVYFRGGNGNCAWPGSLRALPITAATEGC
jgi:hypothetical protein